MGILLAIDGSAIFRRAFEANFEPDPAARADQAIDLAVSSFRRLLTLHAPTHALVAFDAGGPTWRHELHPAFRQNHRPVPVELRERLPILLRMLGELGLHPLHIDRIDADDAVATGALRWLAEGRGDAIVVATDKDLHMLLEFGALVWDPFKSEWHDQAWVEKKFGVLPSQLGDYLALIGDAAGDVPGVSGIGAKKAAALLRGYGSLDGIMAGAGILMDRLGTTLRREKEQLYLSHQLVALKTDATLGATWRMLALRGD